MRFVSVVVCLIALLMSPNLAQSKKPDWGGGGGFAVIGFGLVELAPKKSGDSFVPTQFTFDYDIPAKYAKSVQSGQVLVMPASSLAEYDNIPKSEVLVHGTGAATGSDFHLSAKVTVSEPGLYVVAYGPQVGLITFDQITDDGRETYKISARAEEGGSLRWIDQDAGDFTLMDFDAAKIRSDEHLVLRLRLLRDRASVLSNKGLFKVEPLRLHPKALDRVSLLEANW